MHQVGLFTLPAAGAKSSGVSADEGLMSATAHSKVPERDEELLAPSLGTHRPRARDAARPWRLGSQVYVAFFGGPLAATAIAFANAVRLQVPLSKRMAILGIGLVAFGAVLAVAFGLSDASRQGLRVALNLVAVGGWGVMYLIQRPYERIFMAFGGEEHQSLVVPGLLAVVVCGVLQTAAVAAVVG
jgi:hypothetical protein